MKFGKKILSIGLSLTLCAGMVLPALAVEYNIADGDVFVENDETNGAYSYQAKAEGNTEHVYTKDDAEIVITGTSTENTITVGENVTDTTIILDNVNIDASKTKEAAMSIGANSNVTVELDGDNTLKSGRYHAGLELNNKDSNGQKVENAQGGSVTITDANGTGGSLKATGSDFGGAGIGSGSSKGGIAGNITIEGHAQVTATGGYKGAGIGIASNNGQPGSITIRGNAQVTATGGDNGGAGIGSGAGGTAGDITIEGYADVTANGYSYAAGIGSGAGGTAGDITIKGDAQVTATGGYQGAGIGSGSSKGGTAGNIAIEGRAQVTATGGGNGGAGIGSGRGGTAGDITIKGDAQVTATGGSNGTSVGIGSGSVSARAGDITIGERAQVTAKGNLYGPGIGSNGGTGTGISKVGSITINGQTVVVATSKNGPGIGSGWDGSVSGSSITIDGSSVVLLALSSSSYTAIQYNEYPTSGNINGKNVLNGSFSSVPQGVTQFVVVKADGTVVREFDVSNDGATYRNFAINLPEGEYYILQKGKDGKFVGYGDGGKTVAYTIGDTMLTQKGLGTTESGVNWKFVSGTQGRELPKKVNDKLPTSYVDRFDPVEVEGGSWTFQSWNIGTPKIVDGKLQDVDAVGTWVFEANNTNPGGGGGDFGGIDIADQLVPLASGPITRAQFIDYLWRHEGEPESAGVCTFTDVPEDHEFRAALCWAEENGVAEAYFGVEGHEDGTFEPDEIIDGAGVKAILGNFASAIGTNAVAVADLTTLPEDDGEAVLNCDEVLAEFFGEEYVPAVDEDIDLAA